MMERRHLSDPWRDAFVLELRLQDVRGDRIGDALALVDEHCTDSGESPEEAFGDPVRPATISTGSLVAAGVAGVLVALAIHFFATLVRPGRRVILFAVVWVGTGAVLLPQALIRGTVLDGPAWVFRLAATVLGAAAWSQLRSPRSDAVRDPRDGVDLVPAPSWGQVARRWLLPALLVLAVVIVVLAR